MIPEPVLNAGVIRGGFMNLNYFGQQCSLRFNLNIKYSGSTDYYRKTGLIENLIFPHSRRVFSLHGSNIFGNRIFLHDHDLILP
jgi:hypothetical protein